MLNRDFIINLEQFVKEKQKANDFLLSHTGLFAPVSEEDELTVMTKTLPRPPQFMDSVGEEGSKAISIGYPKSANQLKNFINNRKKLSFSEKLFSLIDKKDIKDSVVYNKAKIDRRLFSKIRSDKNYHPSKVTAVMLCLALELNIDDMNDLLRTAGYILSDSDTFDLVITYCVTHNVYNIMDVNEALDYFSLKPIGVSL